MLLRAAVHRPTQILQGFITSPVLTLGVAEHAGDTPCLPQSDKAVSPCQSAVPCLGPSLSLRSHGRRSLPSVHEMHVCQIQGAFEQPCRQASVTGLGGIFGFGGFLFFWKAIRSAHCSDMVLVHCYVSMLHKIMGFQKCGKRTAWNLTPVHRCPLVIPNSRSRWSCPCFPS